MTDQLWGAYEDLPLHRAYPWNPLVLANSPAYSAISDWSVPYNDVGGAIWQSEPMMEFVRRSIWTLDPPYWNPYSSAGSLGPENLVDLKFSVLTIAYGILGGGSFIYNVLLLALFWLGTYLVIRLVREKLGLSITAGLAAGVFYLLNGYSASNISSNVALSYLFVPPCLFASFSFAERATPRRFAALSVALASLLSFTFLPTTLAELAALFGCTAGYAAALRRGESGQIRTGLTTVALGLLAMCAAFGVVAVIYLPFAESLRTTGLLDIYSARTFHPAFWTGALSLFTPSHFFDSSWLNLDSQAASLSGNAIFHFGVLGATLAASAWRRGSPWHRLVWTCLAIVAVTLARIFAMPGVRELWDAVPVARSLGEQYLWVAVAIPMTLLVAFGADSLISGTVARVPPTVILAAGVAAGVVLGFTYGLHEPNVNGKTIALATTAMLGLLAAAAVWLAPRAKRIRKLSIPGSVILADAIVVLLFFELSADTRWLRFESNDIFVDPTSEVSFLRSHAGSYRTMTLGAYATSMDGGSAYQLQEITSLNSSAPPGFLSYFKEMTRTLPQKYRWGDFPSLAIPQDAPDLDYYDWALVDLLGVKYVVVPKTSVQYLNAFATSHFSRVHDSRFTVVFENQDVLPRAFTIELGAPAGSDVDLPAEIRTILTPATITRYRNMQVEIAGNADGRRLLVLTDNWHENWRASVNGQPAPVVRVNGTFRGIWVSPGSFVVEMSYAPKTLPPAIAISTLTSLCLIAIVLIGPRAPSLNSFRWRRRRAPRSGG